MSFIHFLGLGRWEMFTPILILCSHTTYQKFLTVIDPHILAVSHYIIGMVVVQHSSEMFTCRLTSTMHVSHLLYMPAVAYDCSLHGTNSIL